MDRTTHNIFKRYLGIMLAAYALWIVFYFLSGWIGEIRGPAFSAELPADAAIPLVPWFQPFYLLCYVVTFGLFLISREPAFLNRAYIMFIAANGFAFLFFAAFPVLGPPREAIMPDVSAWHGLLVLNQTLDTQYNAFPSLHVTNPCLVAMLSWREHGLSFKSLLFTLIAVLISVATLFVKQHYVLDVFAGVVLAIGTFLVWRTRPVRSKPL